MSLAFRSTRISTQLFLCIANQTHRLILLRFTVFENYHFRTGAKYIVVRPMSSYSDFSILRSALYSYGKIKQPMIQVNSGICLSVILPHNLVHTVRIIIICLNTRANLY